MNRRLPWTLALVLAVVLGAAGGSRAETAPRLRFNPFARPALEGPGTAGEGLPAAAAGPPRLRATLVAGANSVAVLDGAVLRIGEQAFGYRLVAVRTWEAVFERGGDEIVLSVGEER